MRRGGVGAGRPHGPSHLKPARYRNKSKLSSDSGEFTGKESQLDMSKLSKTPHEWIRRAENTQKSSWTQTSAIKAHLKCFHRRLQGLSANLHPQRLFVPVYRLAKGRAQAHLGPRVLGGSARLARAAPLPGHSGAYPTRAACDVTVELYR